MGTRADFYIGRGKEAEWIGSVAWDGHPESMPQEFWTCDKAENFRQIVVDKMSDRGDWTAPADGWPWPWDDSGTTDYAYAFDEGRVWFSNFGCAWCSDPNMDTEEMPEDVAVFPDMKDVQNVTLGRRSGVIILGQKAAGGES